MKIIEDIHLLPKLNFPILTSGIFDGVHLGHRMILQRVINEAKKNKGESIVLTYWPHPRLVLGKDAEKLKLLNTFEEKSKILEECEIDYLIKIHFTRQFSQLSSKQFIEQYLINGIGVKKIIMGYDHKFGKDQEGSFEYLKQNQKLYNFEIEEINRKDIDEHAVSSTRIRNALNHGEVDLVTNYLGHHYELSGIVVKGEQIGRTIGFPTANIYISEPLKLLPLFGVYIVEVFVGDKKFKGILNLGKKPTFQNQNETIEVHIFDFSDDIYGINIKVKFLKRLRDEKAFLSINDLKNQLLKDKNEAIEWFKSIEK